LPPAAKLRCISRTFYGRNEIMGFKYEVTQGWKMGFKYGWKV
jgi:hypothetical protein